MAIGNIKYMFEGCPSLKEIGVFGIPVDENTAYEGAIPSDLSGAWIRAFDVEGDIWKSWGYGLTDTIPCTAPLDFYNLGTADAATGMATLSLKADYKTALNNAIQTTYYGYEPGKLFPFPVDTSLSLESMFSDMQAMPLLNVISVNFDKVYSLRSTFKNCYTLEEIKGFNANLQFYYTGLYEAFSGCYLLKSLDVSNWNTANVNSLFGTFYQCENLKTLDVSNWDTSMVTSFYQTFWHCWQMETLDVSGWKTPKLTSMYQTFDYCRSLNLIDLSGWDTSLVTEFNNCFSECWAVTKIIGLEDLDVGSATTLDSLLWGCTLLTDIDLTKWNTSKNTSWRYAFGFYKSTSLTSVNLSGLDVSAVTTTEGMFDQQPSTCVVTLPQALFNKMSTFDKGSATFIIADA